MESEFLTVDSLRKILNKASECGFGDMKIKCQDGYLHNDEIGFDYLKREILLRGMIFNSPITEKIKKFCSGIKDLENEFYNNSI